MAVNLSPYGGVGAQFFTNNGVPLAGGKIFTYAAGTTTPQATYTSASGSTAHANPIILDAAGRVPGGEIWLTDGLSYKFVLKDANDITLATYDNVVGINSNFINYTNEQEIQTATAGQTVFTLTTMQYQPGTGSLSVFVDGVNQYGPGAQYAYVETDSTTVTFVTGLHVGASVKFTTAAINAASYGDAFQISYTPPFTGSVTTNVEVKLSEFVSVKDFGAIGDGVADDTNAIQDALDYLRDNGGTLIFPFGVYAVTGQLTLQRSNNIHAKRWVIEGNSSLIQSSYNGEIFVVGATNFSYFVEDGGSAISNLFISGSETVFGNSGAAPTYNQTGLYLYIAGNVNLNNVQTLKCKTGIRTHACFPLKAIDVSARGCWIGAHLDETSNLQDWDNFHAPNCRYSILIKSTTTSFDSGKSNNITFTKWWPEGSEVGMVIDPGSSGGGQPLLRSIAVVEPYIAGITYDIIRLGTAYNFATPGTRGAATADFALDITFRDGLWNNSYSATSAALAFDNNNRVRQVYANIPIPSLDEEANAWVNSPAGGWLTVRAIPNTAYTGETRTYIYNKSGSLVQKIDASGDIEFFGSQGIKFPGGAGVTSSLLKDYEEGTFTPTIKGTTSAGTGTYSTQIGKYTKIGNRVFFDIAIIWSAHTGTGNLRIAGLPYDPAASIFNSCSIGQFDNILLTAGTYAAASVRDDAKEIQFYELVVGGGASSTVAMDAAGGIYVSGSYEAA